MFAPKIKIYTVHGDGEHDAIFIRESFSWAAFMFGPLWTLYHRLWFATFMLAAIFALLAHAGEKGWLDEPRLAVLQFALAVIIGFFANDWRRAKLARQGLHMRDIVASDSLLRAQQRYFDRAQAA